MLGQDVNIAGCRLVARASGALWWPDHSLLCVSDLHLGKSERIARRGSTLLPPYETTETLSRLGDEINALQPDRVVCLGDSFDDDACVAALAEPDLDVLSGLMRGRDWIWVTGNHDPGAMAPGGRCVEALLHGGLVFRHEAAEPGGLGEISGHFHPKIRIRAKGMTISRRCFVVDAVRMMLPAFGAYTGGLRCDDPQIDRLFGADAQAILAGAPCVAIPLRNRSLAMAR